MLKHKFLKMGMKMGMAVAMIGMMGVGQAQSDFNRMINQIAPQPGNNSRFTKSRAQSLEFMVLSPIGSMRNTIKYFASPQGQQSPGAQGMVKGYDFARPYLQELGAPYTDQTGIEALQSKDTKEQCATVVHWNADANNTNAYTSMVVKDNPSADPIKYSGAYNDYVFLNCNW